MDVLFYVSSHGFGHAARQQPLIALLRRQGVSVHARCAAPAKFFQAAYRHAALRFDIGMIQHDPLRFDIRATARWYADFIQREPSILAAEVDYARRQRVQLVLSDMPPFACAVGRALAVPTVVLAHFTWDWVYAHYEPREPAFTPIIAHMRQQYQQAALALQMPFAHPFDLFSQVAPVGLFVNLPTRTREEVRAALRVPRDHRLALLTMGGHSWGSTRLDALAAVTGWMFLLMPDAYRLLRHLRHVRLVPTGAPHYQDYLAAADVVVGKAGGSTVAQVIAAQTAMICTLPHDWREGALLGAGLARCGRAICLPMGAFEAGEWVQHLAQAAELPPAPHTVALDGAQQAAQRILAMLQ